MPENHHIPGAEVVDRLLKPVRQALSGLKAQARARVSARVAPLARRMGIPSPQDVSMLRQEIVRLEKMVSRLEQAIDHTREAVQTDVEQTRPEAAPDALT